MKFCVNCGFELKSTVRFCPKCGTPVSPASDEAGPAQPEASITQAANMGAQPDAGAAQPAAVSVQPKPADAPAENPPSGGMKKKTRMALTIAAIVVVLAVALFVGAGAVLNAPKALIGTSLSNTIKSLKTSNDGAFGVLKNVFSGGSIEVSADLGEWDALYGSVPLAGRIKLYADAPEKKFAAEMSLSYDGDAPVEAALYGSPDAIVLASKSLLNAKYGIKLDKAAANLQKSIFAPDSDSDFAMDEYTYEMLLNLFKSLGENSRNLEKDLTSLYEKYIELLIDTACAAGEAEKESVTLDIGSDKVKTTAITLTLDGKAMAEIVRTVANEAAKDTKLRDTVKKLSRSQLLFGGGYYSFYGMPDEEELDEEVDYIFDNLADNAEELAEEMEQESDIKLILEFFVAKDGKTLAAFNMKAKERGETAYSISLTLGKNIGSSEEISLKVNDGWSDTVLRYVVSENSKKDYSAKLTMQDGYSTRSIKVSWNKSDGAFRVSGEGIELKGTLKQSGKKTTITVKEVGADGYSMDIDLTVVLNESEAVPSPGSFTDVLTLSESALTDLVEDAADRLMDTSLSSLLNTLYWYF